MAKTLIICESTRRGTDKKILASLIDTDKLLPEGYFFWQDTGLSNDGSIKDVFRFLSEGLENYVLNPSLDIGNVLIMVDADDRPDNRFQEIKACLEKLDHHRFNYPLRLQQTAPKVSNKIKVDIFLLPDNQNSGALETLCLKALKGKQKYIKPKLNCVGSYFNCLHTKDLDTNMTTSNLDKSQFRVYTATPNPDGYVHDLLDMVDISSPAFGDLKKFISR